MEKLNLLWNNFESALEEITHPLWVNNNQQTSFIVISGLGYNLAVTDLYSINRESTFLIGNTVNYR